MTAEVEVGVDVGDVGGGGNAVAVFVREPDRVPVGVSLTDAEMLAV